MPDDRFDPTNAVTFDLAAGRIVRAGATQILVGAEELLALVTASVPGPTAAAAQLAETMGAAIGRRVSGRLGAEATRASVDALLDHLGGELALAGLGSLSIERWGQAAVLVVDGSPFGAAGDPFLEHLLAAAIVASAGRAATVVRVARDGSRARFFLGSAKATDRLRTWLAAGASWGEGLVRLHDAKAGGAT